MEDIAMTSQAPPLRILTLDGGGVRGLSEVLILKYLMARLKYIQEKTLNIKVDQLPEPWKYFDLICGTSTGGLLAIMLGRLRMSILECQAAYKELSGQVFAEEKSGVNRYDVDVLKESIRKILRDADESDQSLMFDDRYDSPKAFVVAKRHLSHDSAPVLFKSYEVDGTEILCTVLQAARATTAAPTYFPPEEIEDDQYVDGGIGYNNPAEEALREARRIWPTREIGCLVSVGTGLMEPISGAIKTKEQFGVTLGTVLQKVAPLTAEKLTVAAYCTELATSCQMVHMSLIEHPLLQKRAPKARYYRFNVTSGMSHIGLQESTKLREISQLTDAYLRDPERRETVTDCVELLASESALRAVVGIHAFKLRQPKTFEWKVPHFRNPNFIGREFYLDSIRTSFIQQRAEEPTSIASVALYGAVGMGKTQIAIEYAFRELERKEYSGIFWLDGSSRERLVQSYNDLAQCLFEQSQFGNLELTAKAAVNALQDSVALSNWLIIIDDLNELEKLQDLIPVTGKGSLLITTLNSPASELYFKIALGVEIFSDNETKEFLSKGDVYATGSTEEEAKIKTICDDYPLALEHTVSYLKETSSKLPEYLSRSIANARDTLIHWKPQHFSQPLSYYNTNTVSSLWNGLIERVQRTNPDALELINILSCLDHRGVDISMLQNGSAALPKSAVREVLKSKIRLKKAISTLLSVSFVREAEGSLSLPLVSQAVIRERLAIQKETITWINYAIHIIKTVLPDNADSIESLAKFRRCLPHVLHCRDDANEFSVRTLSLAQMLCKASIYLIDCYSYDISHPIAETALSIRHELLGETSLDTTQSMLDVARIMLKWQYFDGAEGLLLRAKDIRTQGLGRSSPRTLEVHMTLVDLYLRKGLLIPARDLLDEADKALQDCVEGMKSISCAAHYFRADLLHLSHSTKDVTALIEALEIHKETFGENHPKVALVHMRVAEIFAESKYFVQSLLHYFEAKKILEAQGVPNVSLPHLYHNIAWVCFEQGLYAESRQFLLDAQRAAHDLLHDYDRNLSHHWIKYFLELRVALVACRGEDGDFEQLASEALRHTDQWLHAVKDPCADIQYQAYRPILNVGEVACELRFALANLFVKSNLHIDAENLFKTLASHPTSPYWRVWGMLRLLALYGRQGQTERAQILASQLTSEFLTAEFSNWWVALGEFIPTVESLADRNTPTLSDRLTALYTHAVKRAGAVTAISDSEKAKHVAMINGLKRLLKASFGQKVVPEALIFKRRQSV